MKKAKEGPALSDLSDQALDAYVDAAAPLAGLAIAPEYRDGVKLHLRATAKAAEFVLAFDLEDEAEPAPVFRA